MLSQSLETVVSNDFIKQQVLITAFFFFFKACNPEAPENDCFVNITPINHRGKFERKGARPEQQ